MSKNAWYFLKRPVHLSPSIRTYTAKAPAIRPLHECLPLLVTELEDGNTRRALGAPDVFRRYIKKRCNAVRLVLLALSHRGRFVLIFLCPLLSIREPRQKRAGKQLFCLSYLRFLCTCRTALVCVLRMAHSSLPYAVPGIFSSQQIIVIVYSLPPTSPWPSSPPLSAAA